MLTHKRGTKKINRLPKKRSLKKKRKKQKKAKKSKKKTQKFRLLKYDPTAAFQEELGSAESLTSPKIRLLISPADVLYITKRL